MPGGKKRSSSSKNDRCLGLKAIRWTSFTVQSASAKRPPNFNWGHGPFQRLSLFGVEVIHFCPWFDWMQSIPAALGASLRFPVTAFFLNCSKTNPFFFLNQKSCLWTETHRIADKYLMAYGKNAFRGCNSCSPNLPPPSTSLWSFPDFLLPCIHPFVLFHESTRSWGEIFSSFLLLLSFSSAITAIKAPHPLLLLKKRAHPPIRPSTHRSVSSSFFWERIQLRRKKGRRR